MQSLLKTAQDVFSKTIIVIAAVLLVNAQAQSKEDLKKQLLEITKSNAKISENLAKFDTLDFVVFSNRDWKRLHESHAKDIIVHFPDGHSEQGIEQHIKTLDAMFVYAPDTRIEEHPIKIGSGNITAVMGYMLGTFTEPMPIGNGKFIQPTGKKFKLPMTTIGIWKDGVMTEEYLFWDNKTYMEQIGVL